MNEDILDGLFKLDAPDYTEEQYNQELLTFAKRLNMQNATRQDSWISTQASQRYTKFKKEEVQKMLENPRENEAKLREVSRYLYNTSQIYKQTTNYLPSIANVCPIILPTRMNLGTMKVLYERATEYLNYLNLPKNLVSVYKTCFLEDVAYYLEFEVEEDKRDKTKVNSYFLRKLDPDFCRISGVEYGSYIFQFDVTFFLQGNNFDVNMTLLDEYEQYFDDGFFTKAVNKYRKDNRYRWVDIPAEKSLCVKLNEHLDYCLPPYASIYSEIQAINDYKDLALVSEEQKNYKIIGFKIPRFESAKQERPDSFAIKMSTATMFYELAQEALPDTIGIFYTPMDFEPVSFTDSATDSRNRVEETTDQLYDSLGISRLLFNSDNATTLKYSIKVDESTIFQLNRQLETWLTRKFIFKHKGNFTAQLLDVTRLNVDEAFERFLKAGQYGTPVYAQLSALLGMNQHQMMAMNYIQNEILDIPNKFIPMSSSNTQSGATDGGEGGRPTVEDSTSENTVRNQAVGTNEEYNQ